jgi:hypothetical protein
MTAICARMSTSDASPDSIPSRGSDQGSRGSTASPSAPAADCSRSQAASLRSSNSGTSPSPSDCARSKPEAHATSSTSPSAPTAIPWPASASTESSACGTPRQARSAPTSPALATATPRPSRTATTAARLRSSMATAHSASGTSRPKSSARSSRHRDRSKGSHRVRATSETPVVWSREDEHCWEPYGPAAVVELEASLDGDGAVLDWNHDVWSPSHTGRAAAAPDGVSALLAAWRLADPIPRFKPPPMAKLPHLGIHRNADPVGAGNSGAVEPG